MPAGAGGGVVTAKGTALALDLIVAELGRIPEADREEVAAGVLGSLAGRFMLIEHPADIDESEARAQTESTLPWLFPSRGSA